MGKLSEAEPYDPLDFSCPAKESKPYLFPVPYVALIIIAMINVVVSLYYYLLVIKAAYLLESAEALPPLII